MKTATACALGVVLGVLLTLIARDKAVVPTPAPSCPACPRCAEPDLERGSHPARAPRATRASGKSLSAAPLPPLDDGEGAHRERLHDWFEAQARGLVECMGEGAPPRRLLVQMKIEPDGRIARALLIGADDLPAPEAACVREHVQALRVPSEELRGRETVVVHVNL